MFVGHTVFRVGSNRQGEKNRVHWSVVRYCNAVELSPCISLGWVGCGFCCWARGSRDRYRLECHDLVASSPSCAATLRKFGFHTSTNVWFHYVAPTGFPFALRLRLECCSCPAPTLSSCPGKTVALVGTLSATRVVLVFITGTIR